MMIVAYSPKKGFFIGCEPAGFGGVEGPAEFDHNPKKALNLAHGRNVDDQEWNSCQYHLGYISQEAPDAFLMRGTREDLKEMATVYFVMQS